MNNKNSKIIVISVISAIIVVIVLWFAFENKSNPTNNITEENNTDVKVHEILTIEDDDGSKVNISESIKNAKFKIDGLEITNIKLSELVGQTNITAEVKNTTAKKIEGTDVKIILLDSNNKEIVSIDGYIGIVEPYGIAKLNSTTSLDYSNAYGIKIVKNEEK